MKKIVLTGLAVSAALIAGQANAATPVPTTAGVPNWATIAATDYSETFIAGSSAATPFLEEAMRADCTGNIYKYSANGSLAYLCSKADTFTGVATKFLLMHKRDGGGSINGVKAAKGTLQTFLDVASLNSAGITCGTAANSIVSCSGAGVATSATAKASELNFADVDPAQFDSVKNGGSAGLSTGVSATAVATQVFGVVVNTSFRNALQTAAITAGALPATCAAGNETEACMPSLTSSQISTIFAQNGFTDWSNLAYGQTYVYNFLPTDPQNSDVHICARTAGSGTWASMNIKFENAPCNGGLLDQAYALPTTPVIGTETGASGAVKVIHANSGSSDLESCLTAFETGAASGTFTPYPLAAGQKRWAIGVMGLERNGGTGPKPYRFIKIDGYSPSAQNVAEGKYKYWAELVQVGSAVLDPLGQDLLKNLSDPLKIANLNVNQTWQTGNDKSGFLGIANNPIAANGPTSYSNGGIYLNNAQYDYRRPVNPYTHATTTGGVNHCRVPTMPAIGTTVMPLL